MHLSLIAALALAAGPAPGNDVGPVVQALWLVSRQPEPTGVKGQGSCRFAHNFD